MGLFLLRQPGIIIRCQYQKGKGLGHVIVYKVKGDFMVGGPIYNDFKESYEGQIGDHDMTEETELHTWRLPGMLAWNIIFKRGHYQVREVKYTSTAKNNVQVRSWNVMRT
jgi:hypothetical protein